MGSENVSMGTKRVAVLGASRSGGETTGGIRDRRFGSRERNDFKSRFASSNGFFQFWQHFSEKNQFCFLYQSWWSRLGENLELSQKDAFNKTNPYRAHILTEFEFLWISLNIEKS